jgi:collagen type VII alpha
MITLQAGSTLQGKAGTASAISYTVIGGDSLASSTDTYQTLGQGQLGTSAASMLTTSPVPSSTVYLVSSISMANTTGTAVTGITLYVNGTASTNQITGTFTIPANGTAAYGRGIWQIYDATGSLVTGITGPSGTAGAAGATGATGPNSISGSTSTSLTGILEGNGSNVSSLALGTGVATFLGTPTSANLASAITDETGSGSAVFASSPALTGTPTAPTQTAGDNTTAVATDAFVQTATLNNSMPKLLLGALQSASFSVAANTLYPVSAGVNIVATLPASPAIGTLAGVYRSTGIDNIALTANTGQTINGTTSVSIAGALLGQQTIIAIATSSTTWQLISAIGTDAGIGFRTASTMYTGGLLALQAGLTLSLTAETAAATTTSSMPLVECTSGTFKLTLGTSGFGTGQIQVIKNSGTGNITLATVSGTIDNTLLPAGAGVIMMFDGTNWNTVGSYGLAPATVGARMTASQTIGTTVMTAVTGLTFPIITPSVNYAFNVEISGVNIASTSSSAVGVGISVPPGATINYSVYGNTAATTYKNAYVTATATTAAAVQGFVGTSGVTGVLSIYGVVVAGTATSATGSVQVMMNAVGSASTIANTATIQMGSWINAFKVT